MLEMVYDEVIKDQSSVSEFCSHHIGVVEILKRFYFIPLLPTSVPFIHISIRNGICVLQEDLLRMIYSTEIPLFHDLTSPTTTPITNTTSASLSIVPIEYGINDGEEGLDMIIGNDQAKQALFENVILPMNLPNPLKLSLFTGIRANPGHILLYGSPGTGKTEMCKRCAMETGAAFFYVSPSSVLSKYHGESENYLKTLFSTATTSFAKSIIFFDEIDSLGSSRDDLEDNQAKRLLSELLIQLSSLSNKKAKRSSPPSSSSPDQMSCKNKRRRLSDKNNDQTSISSTPTTIQNEEEIINFNEKYEENNEIIKQEEKEEEEGVVVVVAATNRISDLDEALLRRFKCKICVHLPNPSERAQLIEHFLHGVDVSMSTFEFEDWGIRTEGWSGSDLETLVHEAAMIPIRRSMRYLEPFLHPNLHNSTNIQSSCFQIENESKFSLPPISSQDFEEAFSSLIQGNQHEEEEQDLQPLSHSTNNPTISPTYQWSPSISPLHSHLPSTNHPTNSFNPQSSSSSSFSLPPSSPPLPSSNSLHCN